MNVSAIIVTRGDVELEPVLKSLPPTWQLLVWDNGAGRIREWSWDQNVFAPHWNEHVTDLSVYGRYAAIQYATGDVIYVQDDDCIISYPQAIVDTLTFRSRDDLVVCNMPPEFRHDFYTDHALVGFGAAFHRDAPEMVFERFWDRMLDLGLLTKHNLRAGSNFQRTCDVVFTSLSPYVLVDVPKQNLPHAYAADRMYRQPEHQGERAAMLELARKVKESS